MSSVTSQPWFWPALLLTAWVLGRRVRRSAVAAAVVVGLVGAVSLALALMGSAGLETPLIPDVFVGFYGPATRAWEFAAGAFMIKRISITFLRAADYEIRIVLVLDRLNAVELFDRPGANSC